MDEATVQPAPDAAVLPVPPDLPAPPEEASPIEKIKQADQAREGFPGEHWLVLAAGVAIWQFTRRHRSWAVRTAGALVASMLAARAASGREGLARALRYTPWGGRISRCPPCEQRPS